MKDRTRESLGAATLKALAREGVYVDAKGTFKVGEVQIPSAEISVIASTLPEAIDKVARREGEEHLKRALDNSTSRQDVLRDTINALRETDIEKLSG